MMKMDGLKERIQQLLQKKYLFPVCLLSPLLSYIVNLYSEQYLWGYRFGFEILLLNAFICFIGLWLIRLPRLKAVSPGESRSV